MVVPPLVNSIEGEALRNASVMLAASVNKIPRRTTTSNRHLQIYYYSAMLNKNYGIDAQLLAGLNPAPLGESLVAGTITLVFP
jgi:hypothetical protein